MTSPPVAALLERHLGLAPGSVGDRVIERGRPPPDGGHRVRDRPPTTSPGWPPTAAELDELAEEVVVPETWFFRYPESFRAPGAAVGGAAAGRPVRVLSVPCRTGEEPYSLAVALLDAGFAPASFRVEAVDVSRRAVEAATAGVYRAVRVPRDRRRGRATGTSTGRRPAGRSGTRSGRRSRSGSAT